MVSGSLRATDSLLATTGVFDQSITITSQEAIPHLIFSRDHNYICFPSGGSFRITAGTTVNAKKYCPLIVEGTVDSDGITTATNVYPGVSNKANLGLSDYKWANVYATTFIGSLQGNADTATTATNANYLISNTRMDYGWNGINYFNLSAARSATVKNNQTPYASATWTHILRFNHANNAGYYTDLAIPFNGNSVWYRRIANGALQNASYDSNTGWVELLDAINYTEYTVTKTGTGASGTWGISITGNAATATNADYTKYYWHDLFSFCCIAAPTYQTSTNGSSWTAATLDKVIFDQKNDTGITLFENSIKAHRWIWDNAGFSWSNGAYVVVQLRYAGTSATSTIKIETSADNSTWTQRGTKSGTWNAESIVIPIDNYGGDHYIRITITKTSDTGTSALANLRLLSKRPGGQGMGIEYEYPYGWDKDKNILGNAVQSLGTTANPFHNIVLGGTTNATMTAASTNPRITFEENTSVQPVHLIYTDHDTYRSPAGLKVIGGTDATPAWFEVEGNIYNGGSIYTTKAGECGLEVNNTQATNPNQGAFIVGGSGNLGIYSRKHSKWVVYSDPSGNVALNGNAATATALSNVASDQSASNVAGALQAFWNAKKSTMPRNQLISFTSSHSGRAMHMGYFISGYDSNPYGGFFTAFYNTPYYSCSSNGTFSCSELVRNDSRTYSISVNGSSASCTGNAATASAVAWTGVTGRPTIDKTTVIYQISRGATFDPIQSGYFAGMSTSTGITSDWWHILSMDWSGDDKNNWLSQLALPTQNRTGVYYRSRHSSTTYDWKKLWTSGESITNAVWNDYAECRIADTQEPGRVLMEIGNDTLTPTTERMSHFAGVSSDTWGFLQGETDVAKTPLAVAGRTLVYPYRDRNEYKPGDCVCAAPNGTVDLMTREEVIKYPDRIVGTVSCVPEYEEWGGSDANIEDRPPIKVNGRIWIKVK